METVYSADALEPPTKVPRSSADSPVASAPTLTPTPEAHAQEQQGSHQQQLPGPAQEQQQQQHFTHVEALGHLQTAAQQPSAFITDTAHQTPTGDAETLAPGAHVQVAEDSKERQQSNSSASQVLEPLIGLHRCTLLCTGSKAKIWRTTFCGKPTVVKQFLPHQGQDAQQINQGMKKEVANMLRAWKAGMQVPVVYYVEQPANCIYMEHVEGKSLKALLLEDALAQADVNQIMAAVGTRLAWLHDAGVVHGGLTTACMIIRDPDQQVVFLDFSQSYYSLHHEDKAFDLYQLEQALTSAHPNAAPLMDKILASYRQHSKQWSSTHNRLADIRKRGTKRKAQN